MNAVGIDVSKGKSMVAVMRSLGKVVVKPFMVCYTATELENLISFLKSLDGEVRVVMECTGRYYEPIARYLRNNGIFVATVHAKLIHDFGNNSIRKVKTDKADALKIASYGLANWISLREYSPEDETRFLLKNCNRQYNQCMKLMIASKNNLIALLDQTFPGVNTLFSSFVRQDGHEKWVDFVGKFWHSEYVSTFSLSAFTARYNNWCSKSGYMGSDAKAEKIYAFAKEQVPTLPKNEATKKLVQLAVAQLKSLLETLAALRQEMYRLAQSLPEFPVVMAMYGVGSTCGSQLIAEIGDIRRFKHKKALVAFAGVDAPPYQSGSYESKNRNISKRGSPHLRKTLFQIMSCILRTAPADDPVFQFLDRKRAEGKNYCVYMIAGANKFLRIYYARVKEYLDQFGV